MHFPRVPTGGPRCLEMDSSRRLLWNVEPDRTGRFEKPKPACGGLNRSDQRNSFVPPINLQTTQVGSAHSGKNEWLDVLAAFRSQPEDSTNFRVPEFRSGTLGAPEAASTTTKVNLCDQPVPRGQLRVPKVKYQGAVPSLMIRYDGVALRQRASDSRTFEQLPTEVLNAITQTHLQPVTNDHERPSKCRSHRDRMES